MSLPRPCRAGMGFDYFGMSFQEQQAAKGVPRIAIFGLSLVFVFLILAALYESWSLPVSVLISTPVAVLGAFLALWARRFENNVYVQIGLIMLIGLSAKNAILIVEFAKREFERGKSLVDAALTGARIRLRPILMTSFAFVFGCIPLWFATGSGGISRETLGTVVIGGMLGSTLLGIFIIPVNFYVVERLAHRNKKHAACAFRKPQPSHELAAFAWFLLPRSGAGCAVGPDYKSPGAHPPAAFRGAEERREPIPWATCPGGVVSGPGLAGPDRSALTNNYDLRVAAARVEESRALLAQSRSRLLSPGELPRLERGGEKCCGRRPLRQRRRGGKRQ